MRWFAIATVTFLSLAGVAVAQESTEKPAERRRPPAAASARPAVLIERLSQELNLDQQQQGQYREIASKYRQRLADPARSGQDLAENARQLREAREDDDDAKARALREQMRARRGNREIMQSFLDELETILRDDQKEKLGQVRDRIMEASRTNGMRRDGARTGPGPLARIRELRSSLKLTPEQEPQFDEMANALRGKVDPEGQTPIRELMEEMREAMTGGDQAKTAELRAQLGERRKVVDDAMRKFNEQLQPLLSDEQKTTLANFRERLGRGPAGGPPGIGPEAEPGVGAPGQTGPARLDPRMLLRAAKRLELTDAQKEQIDALEGGLRGKIRDAHRDHEQMQQLRSETERQIRDLLTPAQIEEFERVLERQSRGPQAKRSRAASNDNPDSSGLSERSARRKLRGGEKPPAENPKP